VGCQLHTVHLFRAGFAFGRTPLSLFIGKTLGRFSKRIHTLAFAQNNSSAHLNVAQTAGTQESFECIVLIQNFIVR
jgi:hypothetical protein